MIRRVGANPLLKPISKMSLFRLLRSCLPITVYAILKKIFLDRFEKLGVVVGLTRRMLTTFINPDVLGPCYRLSGPNGRSSFLPGMRNFVSGDLTVTKWLLVHKNSSWRFTNSNRIQLTNYSCRCRSKK